MLLGSELNSPFVTAPWHNVTAAKKCKDQTENKILELVNSTQNIHSNYDCYDFC